LLAQILERDVNPVTYPLVNHSRNANPARLRHSFKPSRDVHPIAVDVVSVDHHVAQVDADAKHDPLVLW
jgi:hypothetical protein